MDVKPSRSREPAYNQFHRVLGWDCPVTDIDWLEYDQRKATALIETKKKGESEGEANLGAMADLAARANLPFFKVYPFLSLGDENRFLTVPMNANARIHLLDDLNMRASEFARWLYRIRGRNCPPEILEAAKNWRPNDLD
jgi:hypothetical protein